MRKLFALLLAVLIATLIAFNYFFASTPSFFKAGKESVVVARVIDGDTLELQDGRVLRLLNINTPEKNMPAAGLSIDLLKEYENDSLQIEVEGIDKYQRSLARLYAPDYLNLQLVKQGWASKFLVHEEETSLFAEAEKQAIQEGRGMWKHSQGYGCFTTDIDKKSEIVSFTRTCSIDSMEGWWLKDESRKTFVFTKTPEKHFTLSSQGGKDNATALFWNAATDVWNNDRDALYLFDANNQIVHYESYGY